jgi:predicted enzyme related to lactoylglutathione lyase
LKYVNPAEIGPAVDPQVPFAGQIRMIGVLCDDLGEAIDRAVSLGGKFVGDGTQIAGDYRFGYVMGPDNVIFMLTEQRDWQEIAANKNSDDPWQQINFF